MDSCNISLTPKSRGKGKCAAGELSYITRSKLVDITTGLACSSREKKDLVWASVFLAEGANEDWRDLQLFADAMELASSRKDARICKSFILPLPNELSRESQIAISEEYGEHLAKQGLCAATGLHEPVADESKGEKKNDHLHIVTSQKPCKDGKFVAGTTTCYRCKQDGKEVWLLPIQFNAAKESKHPAEKIYRYYPKDEKPTKENSVYLTPSEYKANYAETHVRYGKKPVSKKVDLTEWETSEWLVAERKFAADLVNKYLELEKFEHRVSEKSYKDRGIEKVPKKHLGTKAADMERKRPGSSELGRVNQKIEARNAAIQSINELIKDGYISDPVDLDAAQEIKKELLENEDAELHHLSFENLQVFDTVIRLLEEARQLFCAYQKKGEGVILFLKSAAEAIKEIAGRFMKKEHRSVDDLVSDARDKAGTPAGEKALDKDFDDLTM